MCDHINEKDYGHKPVLLRECLDALAIRPDGVYVDGTLGRAGHSLEIVRRLTAGGRLIGIDRDQTAIDAARERLASYLDRVTLVHSNFDRIGDILADLHIPGVDGMLFDLGVSSPQLDETQRGFSYMHDAPLDMRMDATSGLSAWNVVNEWPENELKRSLYEYGEERYAPRIAGAIVRARAQRPISTTLELVDVIRSAMPGAALREKQHPAKRSFQAIRIAVNDELAAVREMMDTAPDKLRVGGRLCVISFHSLEDRINKKTQQALANGCTCPPNFPVCVCGKKPKMKLVSRKPIVAGEAELVYNPRARSAKLRVAEKLKSPAKKIYFLEIDKITKARKRKPWHRAMIGADMDIRTVPWHTIWTTLPESAHWMMPVAWSPSAGSRWRPPDGRASPVLRLSSPRWFWPARRC